MQAKARRHFQTIDPTLFSVIDRIEPFELVTRDDYFFALCQEIIGQQLAGKAAHAIFQRFQKLFPNGKITSTRVMKLSEEQIRNIGTSWSKARYIKNLAQTVTDGTVNLDNIASYDDEGVIAELTKVKGIGPWTAEMFLMFTLGREDVFSYGDLGLKKAIKKLYGFKKDPTVKQMEKIVNKWKPYRTYAARILWKSLDG